MEITRFGHACLLVEVLDQQILIDPGGFSPDTAFELEGLDGIAITHQHPDHYDPDRIDGLVRGNPGATLLAEPQTADLLRERGGPWRDFAPGQTEEIGGATLSGIGGQHAIIHPDMPRIGNVGVLLDADGVRFFHPGDSYEYVPDDVDVLAVPLAAPWAKISETVDFVRAVGPRVVFPIHDGTIAPPGYALYWSRISELGGVSDARRLGQDESTTI